MSRKAFLLLNASALLITSFLVSQSLEASHIGVITMAKGRVELFTKPGKERRGKGPHVLYQGKYYTNSKAKMGTKVRWGNVVHTGPNGQARVVFPNGDHVSVGPGTSYSLKWDKKAAKPKATLNLVYGKMRAMISKKGPRSKMKVRTPSVVAGVRGTDFYVSYSPTAKNSQVSVLRGEVAVKATNVKRAKTVKVKTGYKVDVQEAKPLPKAALKAKTKVEAPKVAVVLKKATKQDFVEIQKSSKIELTAVEEKAVDKKLLKQVEKLEKKAVKTTMEDIKQTDPKLFEAIQQKTAEKQVATADILDTAVVAQLYKEAPKAPEARKPASSDLDFDENEVYEKYFRWEN